MTAVREEKKGEDMSGPLGISESIKVYPDRCHAFVFL